VKVHIDRDIEGYRPEPGKVDRDGNEVEDRIYNQKDFDRTLVIDDRTKLVAKKISDFLRESEDRFQKTIVFCVDTEHAARMQQALVNENSDLAPQFPKYVMRITGNDDQGLARQSAGLRDQFTIRQGAECIALSRFHHDTCIPSSLSTAQNAPRDARRPRPSGQCSAMKIDRSTGRGPRQGSSVVATRSRFQR
jgi:hypothetical protein